MLGRYSDIGSEQLENPIGEKLWSLSALDGRWGPWWVHIAGSTPRVTPLAIGFALLDVLLLLSLKKGVEEYAVLGIAYNVFVMQISQY